LARLEHDGSKKLVTTNLSINCINLSIRPDFSSNLSVKEALAGIKYSIHDVITVLESCDICKISMYDNLNLKPTNTGLIFYMNFYLKDGLRVDFICC